MPVAKQYRILVVWHDGSEEFLKEGLSDIPARFSSRRAAEAQQEFLAIGLESAQSINVVLED